MPARKEEPRAAPLRRTRLKGSREGRARGYLGIKKSTTLTNSNLDHGERTFAKKRRLEAS